MSPLCNFGRLKEQVVPYQQLNISKKDQVELMFDRIAFRYDLMNHLLSFGVDVIWRKRIVSFLRKRKPKTILDAATGTADVAIQMAELQPQQITGIDISEQMLTIARQKVSKRKLGSSINLVRADSENLPFEDNKFDAVTVAFGVRNFENLERGLAELYRVLKTNGDIVILEFSKPEHFPFKQLFQFYFTNVCPVLGKWLTKDKTAYEYLHRSVTEFPYGKAFAAVLAKAGFEETQCRSLTFGISSLYTAKKY